MTPELLESFKQEYPTADKLYLEEKYNRTWENLKCLASRHKLVRDKSVIVYGTKESKLLIDVAEMARLYVDENKNTPEIAAIAGIPNSHHYVRDLLKAHDVTMRTTGESRRKYTADRRFFQTIDTSAKAYFLGFLFADGCNHTSSNEVGLNLHHEDAEVIHNFKKALNSDHPIKNVKANGSSDAQVKISLLYSEMQDDLLQYGLTPAKSLTLQFPANIKDEFMGDMLAGYFDGDGSINMSPIYYSQSRCDFTGTKEFLDGIISNCTRLLGELHYTLQNVTGNNTWRLWFHTEETLNKLYGFMYANENPPRLQRKQMEFKAVIDGLASDSVGLNPIRVTPENRKPIGRKPKTVTIEDVEQFKVDFVNPAITEKQLTDKYNVPNFYFLKREATKLGLTREADHTCTKYKSANLDVLELLRIQKEEGLGNRELAKRFNCSHVTIGAKIREYKSKQPS